MTPDAAFGFERRGTPTALSELGASDGFEVVVVPTFRLDGRDVRSSSIRECIAAGDLAGAARLLGRPVTVTGSVADPVDGVTRLEFALPVALPPDGDYPGRLAGVASTLRVANGEAMVLGPVPNGRLTIALEAL